MPNERRQFRVLYRDFLFRMVDIELLSAAGDVHKLLAQFGAMLAAFGFTITVFTLGPLVRSSLPYEKLSFALRTEQEFLIATTMAIAGLFSVLAWNAVFPDRRDSLILGLLPIRIRTIFLAKVAAIATALGVSIAAVNLFTGLFFPFLAAPPNAGLLGGLRSLGTHWLVMAAAGLFVCSVLLALEGVAAQFLSYRLFLRVSSFLQLAAFFGILGLYFLKPSFSAVAQSSWPARFLPSFWFCGLLQVLNGASGPQFGTLALRALWALPTALSTAAATFALAYRRNIRRIIEQPDIAPADRSKPATRIGSYLAAKLLAKPIERAIVLFTARTIARSRQHRLLLAAYTGIGLAIALAYARDFFYRSPLADARHLDPRWNQLNVPFLVASLVLLFFAVIGARGVFAMPMALQANWIFRITAVHSPAAYSAAVRKALFALTAIPIWILSAILFSAIWPGRFAWQHVAILIVTGILLVETALHRFRKIPFACSYLPGKAKLHIRLGTVGVVFLVAADLGVRIEYWAMHKTARFAVLFGILLAAAIWASRRTAEFARSPANQLQFEDLPPAEVNALDLRSDGAWSRDEAYVDAVDPQPQTPVKPVLPSA
ncbi:MAG: hypothetical protein LAQ69_01420 [Acidobacteriia bacterium]|nr:hypothetical protein [Terriglobia bacterium]